MQYGCIGEHLAHSFSKEIHNKIADYNYELCEIARENLDDFMKEKNFKAINVTIPYKEAVIPYLYYIDDSAKEIGAVNTIVNKDGKLYGYNTDFMGMSVLAYKTGLDFKDKKVLVLGTGGTSKTATAVAKSKGAKEVIKVSRKNGVTYEDAKKLHSDAKIIINTTPCGMFPDNYSSPIDLDDFPLVEGVLDAVYNPIVTKLVASALNKGIKASSGLYMLVAQAVFASEKFVDTKYDAEIINKVYNEILKEKRNIVLTGMPGCGKSTVGKILAEMTNKNFVDTDDLIIKEHGSITEIFEKYGEKTFRDFETDAVKEASKSNSQIIATGGGAILKDENVDALKSNGIVFFIDRPLESLIPTDDRPLAKDKDAIIKRYNERYEKYLSSAHVVIKADCSAEDVAKKIINYME